MLTLTIVTFFAILLCLQILLWLRRWYTNYQKLKHISGVSQPIYFPFRIPLLAPRLNHQDRKSILEMMKENGDNETRTTRVTFIDYNLLVVSDRNLLKELFTLKQSYFEKPSHLYEMFNIFGESILSALKTETWKKHHSSCHAAFTDDNLRYMCQVAVDSLELIYETKWKHLPKRDDNYFEIDASVDISDLTLEILGKSGFGFSFGVFNNDSDGREFASALSYLMNVGFAIRRFFIHYPLLYVLISKVSGLEKSIEIIKTKLMKCIDERRKEIEMNDSSRRDILSLLVKANMLDHSLTNDELVSNTFTMGVAGFHTSSTSLQWAMFELSRNIEIQNKARQEVFDILGRDKNPTFDDYEKFHYLNAIIHETLRLHTVVTSISKQVCKKDTTLGKFNIPKGTEIEIFIAGAHLDERNWENPFEFNPKRFLDSKGHFSSGHDYKFLPFSRGLRRCIGFRFAEREIFVILCRMLQKFSFSIIEPEKVGELVRVTVNPTNLRVLLKEIK